MECIFYFLRVCSKKRVQIYPAVQCIEPNTNEICKEMNSSASSAECVVGGSYSDISSIFDLEYNIFNNNVRDNVVKDTGVKDNNIGNHDKIKLYKNIRSINDYTIELQTILDKYKRYSYKLEVHYTAIYKLSLHTYSMLTKTKALFFATLNEFELYYDNNKYVEKSQEVFEMYENKYKDRIKYLYENKRLIIDKELLLLKDVNYLTKN